MKKRESKRMTKSKTNPNATALASLAKFGVQQDLLSQVRAQFGTKITRAESKTYELAHKVSLRFLRADKANRLSRGVYQIPAASLIGGPIDGARRAALAIGGPIGGSVAPPPPDEGVTDATDAMDATAAVA